MLNVSLRGFALHDMARQAESFSKQRTFRPKLTVVHVNKIASLVFKYAERFFCIRWLTDGRVSNPPSAQLV